MLSRYRQLLLRGIPGNLGKTMHGAYVVICRGFDSRHVKHVAKWYSNH